MKRSWIMLAAATLGLAACAEFLNKLEEATPEDSIAGKAVRGVNRLRKSFQDLDPSEEHYIGRSVAAQIIAMPAYKVSEDAALAQYLNLVGNGIVMSCDEVRHTFIGYRFAVVDTDEVNAFACPGGTIFVTRGLIKKTRTEDELAGVLAHEIAHVHLRHGLAAIQQGNLMEAFQYLGASAAQATLKGKDLEKVTGLFQSSVGDIVNAMVKNGYSKDAEYAADQTGQHFATVAGYDSKGLREVLQRLGQEGGQGGMFSTHPAPADRLAQLPPPAPAKKPDATGEAARAQRYALAVRP